MDLGLLVMDNGLNHLRFADDLILLEECPKKLELMIKTLTDKCSKIGLEMNAHRKLKADD